MDSIATIGIATTYALSDHIHPTDTTLLPLTGGTITGDLTITSGEAENPIMGNLVV
jgi:hypothetical protein